MSFLGNFADLTGLRIDNFTVLSIAGRDSARAPRWRVLCGECCQEQVIPHAKLAAVLESKAPANLRCANAACPSSWSQTNHSESLAEFRQRQRREADEAAQADAEKQEAAEIEAAQQRAEEARLAALKAEYRFYFNHQLRTEAKESDIVPLERWQQLTNETRRMVLERISKDPAVWFRGL
jgi:hypothetical protein